MTDPARRTGSPKRKSILKQWLRASLLLVAPSLLRILICTWRTKFENPNGIDLNGPHVMVTWHENLAALAPYGLGLRPRLAILVSASRDGDAGVDLAHRLGVKTVRGSSSRGGSSAILNMSRLLREDQLLMGILLDGPRGPRRQAKAGPSMVSALGQIPIIPIGAHPSAYWRIRSWDRTVIPKPFATIRVVLGPAILPPDSTDRDVLERHRLRIEQELLNLSLHEPDDKKPT